MRRRVPFFLACATVAICGLVVIAKALLDRKPCTRSLPGIGRLEYCAFADGKVAVLLDREDNVGLAILYDNGQARDLVLTHPEGHPLERKVQPLPDGSAHQRNRRRSDVPEASEHRQPCPVRFSTGRGDDRCACRLDAGY